MNKPQGSRPAAKAATAAAAPEVAPSPAPAEQAVAANAATASNAVVPLTEEEELLQKYSGAGMEEFNAKTMAPSFFRVLQTNSPEVDEAHANFVNGAKAGMLFNTVTKELFDGKEGAIVIPCHFQRKQLRWAPRGSAQSYKGEVTEVEAAEARAANKLVEYENRWYFTDDGKVDDKKNDRLVDTRIHYVLIVDKDGGVKRAIFPLASTSIKPSSVWNAMQADRKITVGGKMITEPAMFNAYTVTTVRKSNDKGAWYIPNFTWLRRNDSNLLRLGGEFHDALVSGAVEADLAATREDTADAPAGDPDKF